LFEERGPRLRDWVVDIGQRDARRQNVLYAVFVSTAFYSSVHNNFWINIMFDIIAEGCVLCILSCVVMKVPTQQFVEY
jgi:hypothetical protein